MTPEDFEKRLDKLLGLEEAVTEFDKTVEAIRTICQQIQDRLSDQARLGLVVSLQPGFRAQMGQQLNIVIEIPQRHYQDTLFRAYVPPNGVPVHLDFYGEQAQVCQTIPDMQEGILDFLSDLAVQSRMKAYRDLAR